MGSRDQKPVGKGWSSICGHLQFSIGSGSICFLCCVSFIPLLPYQLYCALCPFKWDLCCNLLPLFLLWENIHFKGVQNMSCAPQCYSLWVLANIRGIIVKFSHVSMFSDIGPSPSRVSLVASCVQAELWLAIVNVNVILHNYHNSTTYLTIFLW